MTDIVREKNEVKKVIRSLLISAPCGLTMQQLSKDYYAMMKKNIPFREFGFYNASDFVSSLRDIMYVRYIGPNMLFFGIADEKTIHIQKMVRKQKKTKLYTSIEAQDSVPRKITAKKFGSPVLKSVYPSARFRTGILKVVKAYPDGISLSRLNEVYQTVNGVPMNVDTTDTDYIGKLILNMPDIAVLEYGRTDRKGNNLFLYPSKKLSKYHQMVTEKVPLMVFSGTHQPTTTTVVTTMFSFTAPPSVTTAISTSVPKVTQSNEIAISKHSNTVMSSKIASSPMKSGTDQNNNQQTFSSSPRNLNASFQNNETSRNLIPRSKVVDAANGKAHTKVNGLAKKSKSESNNSFKFHFFKDIVADSKPVPTRQQCAKAEKNRPDKDFAHLTADDLFESSTAPACDRVRNQVIEVLSEHPRGIWSSDLLELFKKKFGRELELRCYGYFSIIEFISTMVDRVKIVRPEACGDWVINLRSNSTDTETNMDSVSVNMDKKVMLKDVEKEILELMKRFKGGILCNCLEDVYLMHFGKKFPCDELGFSVGDVLCKILNKLSIVEGHLVASMSSVEWNKEKVRKQVLPIDAVGSGVTYNPVETPTTGWGFFDVFVSYVATPGSFAMQLVGQETSKAFDSLMDEMEKCYCSPTAKTYKMPDHMAKVGQICVTVNHVDMNWNRVMITDNPRDGMVEVLFVDYGDQSTVPVSSLYFLKSCFLELPAQMVCARLSHLQPADMESWEFVAKKTMLDLTRQKSLVAQVTSVDKLNKVSVFLCDTSREDGVDVYINDALLEEGLAQHVDDGLPENEVELIRSRVKEKIKKKESKKQNERIQNQVPPYLPHDQPSTSMYKDKPPSYDEIDSEPSFDEFNNGLRSHGNSGSIFSDASTVNPQSTVFESDDFSDDYFLSSSHTQPVSSVSKLDRDSSSSSDICSTIGSVIGNARNKFLVGKPSSSHLDLTVGDCVKGNDSVLSQHKTGSPETSSVEKSNLLDVSGPLITFNDSPTSNDFDKGENSCSAISGTSKNETEILRDSQKPKYFCREKIPLLACSGLEIDYQLNNHNDYEGSHDLVSSCGDASCRNVKADLESFLVAEPYVDQCHIDKEISPKFVKVLEKTPKKVAFTNKPSTNTEPDHKSSKVEALPDIPSTMVVPDNKPSSTNASPDKPFTSAALELDDLPTLEAAAFSDKVSTSKSNAEGSNKDDLLSYRGFSSNLLKLMHVSTFLKRSKLIEDDDRSTVSLNKIKNYTAEMDKIERILEVKGGLTRKDGTFLSSTRQCIENCSSTLPNNVEPVVEDSRDSEFGEYFGEIPYDNSSWTNDDIFSTIDVNAEQSSLNPMSVPFIKTRPQPNQTLPGKQLPSLNNVATVTPYSHLDLKPRPQVLVNHPAQLQYGYVASIPPNVHRQVQSDILPANSIIAPAHSVPSALVPQQIWLTKY